MEEQEIGQLMYIVQESDGTRKLVHYVDTPNGVFLQPLESTGPESTESEKENLASLQSPSINRGGQDFNWTRATTLLLIQNYNVLSNQFRDPKVKKKPLWTKIKSEFEKRGYELTEDILDRKWRNLKKTFMTIKDNIKKSGRGRISWEYFEDFEEIYKEDKCVNLPKTISSVLQLTPSSSVGSLPLNKPSEDSPVIDANAQTSSLNTPSRSEGGGKEGKARSMRGLYQYRKQQADLEEQRVEEIRKLRLVIEKNNIIQEQRNAILERYLANINNNVQ